MYYLELTRVIIQNMQHFPGLYQLLYLGLEVAVTIIGALSFVNVTINQTTTYSHFLLQFVVSKFWWSVWVGWSMDLSSNMGIQVPFAIFTPKRLLMACNICKIIKGRWWLISVF